MAWLFALSSLAVAFAVDGAIPDDLRAAAEMLKPPLTGFQELEAAAEAWAGQDDSKVKAGKIIDNLQKAADAGHDAFVGLRVFAKSLQKALDQDDAALAKALGMHDKFIKAVGKLTKKVVLAEKHERYERFDKERKERLAKDEQQKALKAYEARAGDAGVDEKSLEKDVVADAAQVLKNLEDTIATRDEEAAAAKAAGSAQSEL